MESTDRRRRVNEEAAEWWLQLQAKETPRDQREAFVDWLRESPVHVAEMLRVASVHGALEQFENWARIATQDSGGEEQVVLALHTSDVPAPAGSRWLRRAWPIAAAVAGLALATVLLLPALRGQVMATERGERREVVLADGSIVQIDPESRLRVRFAEHTRRVALDSGRALFRVATNPDRPFLVEADSTTVRAVGTAFAVERKEQDVIVTVSEGKVAIESRDRDLAPAFLTANEQVAVSSGGAAAGPIRKVDSARALAWAEGRLNFENTPLREVVAQFNRYNNIQLRVEDEKLASRPISGVFNAANPQSFIDFVEATTAVRVTRDSDGAIVIASDR
jgi:transmembrane sensor